MVPYAMMEGLIPYPTIMETYMDRIHENMWHSLALTMALVILRSTSTTLILITLYNVPFSLDMRNIIKESEVNTMASEENVSSGNGELII